MLIRQLLAFIFVLSSFFAVFSKAEVSETDVSKTDAPETEVLTNQTSQTENTDIAVSVDPAGPEPLGDESVEPLTSLPEEIVPLDSESNSTEQANGEAINSPHIAVTDGPLSAQVEDIKKASLELNRDLLLLEEDLLFPANTQIAVYVSMDVGTYFELDAVKLKINDELVASHLYTEKQNSALIRGGIQRLYLGNLKTGSHELTAFFHGYGPERREYKRGATFNLKKDQSPTMLEIRIRDSKKTMQPDFDFKEWHL